MPGHDLRADDPPRPVPSCARPGTESPIMPRCARDGRVGYGIFELGSIGRHTPSGSTGKEAL
ncbi:hypothetical protein ACFWVC_05255 [Streptomyces sp. NPDC058691]|uniref:hypothetical protein n=1 Tax=Streptomyces sp. NPDC058691 TaxID=3346601 RepID=UPI00364F1435